MFKCYCKCVFKRPKISAPVFSINEADLWSLSSKQNISGRCVRAAILNDNVNEMGRYKRNILHCAKKNRIQHENDQWRLQ